MGRTRGELVELLTADDLALYQALVEIDGPFWGKRETAMMAQLCSLQAAAGGVHIPADEFEIEWRVGESAEAGGNMLAPAEGLELFAALHGLKVEVVP